MNRKFLIIILLGILSLLTFDARQTETKDVLVLNGRELLICGDGTGTSVTPELLASITAYDTGLSTPRPTSFSGQSRIQSNGKRNTQSNRLQFTLLKGGKTINTNNLRTISLDFVKFPSGFSEVTHHLISLGKLII